MTPLGTFNDVMNTSDVENMIESVWFFRSPDLQVSLIVDCFEVFVHHIFIVLKGDLILDFSMLSLFLYSGPRPSTDTDTADEAN